MLHLLRKVVGAKQLNLTPGFASDFGICCGTLNLVLEAVLRRWRLLQRDDGALQVDCISCLQMSISLIVLLILLDSLDTDSVTERPGHDVLETAMAILTQDP